MRVNGTVIFVKDKQKLLDFLSANKYDITKIAVERNGKIVPKADYGMVMLKDEDTLEIVSFVGGG